MSFPFLSQRPLYPLLFSFLDKCLSARTRFHSYTPALRGLPFCLRLPVALPSPLAVIFWLHLTSVLDTLVHSGFSLTFFFFSQDSPLRGQYCIAHSQVTGYVYSLLILWCLSCVPRQVSFTMVLPQALGELAKFSLAFVFVACCFRRCFRDHGMWYI